MGRAIDMENKINALEIKVNEILLMLDELSKVNTTQEHIDLHETTKEEKANNESDDKSSGKSNKGKSKSKAKSNVSSSSSK